MTDNDSSPWYVTRSWMPVVSIVRCPLLKAKLELNRLPSGGVLKVIATDAGSQRDFRAFAQLAGHELLREEAAEGVYRYWLRKR